MSGLSETAASARGDHRILNEDPRATLIRLMSLSITGLEGCGVICRGIENTIVLPNLPGRRSVSELRRTYKQCNSRS
jgi:hypothetical protein